MNSGSNYQHVDEDNLDLHESPSQVKQLQIHRKQHIAERVETHHFYRVQKVFQSTNTCQDIFVIWCAMTGHGSKMTIYDSDRWSRYFRQTMLTLEYWSLLTQPINSFCISARIPKYYIYKSAISSTYCYNLIFFYSWSLQSVFAIGTVTCATWDTDTAQELIQ